MESFCQCSLARTASGLAVTERLSTNWLVVLQMKGKKIFAHLERCEKDSSNGICSSFLKNEEGAGWIRYGMEACLGSGESFLRDAL